MLMLELCSLFLIATSDLVSIFLSIELQSYGLYLLSTIYRNSESATSGGLIMFYICYYILYILLYFIFIIIFYICYYIYLFIYLIYLYAKFIIY